MLRTERQTLTGFQLLFFLLGVFVRTRLFLQPLIQIDTKLSSYTDIRLIELNGFVRRLVQLIDSHTVGINESGIIHGNIVFAFLRIGGSNRVVDLRSQEEVITAELSTEHDRHAYLHQMTHFRHAVEEIVVLRIVSQVGTLCIESID